MPIMQLIMLPVSGSAMIVKSFQKTQLYVEYNCETIFICDYDYSRISFVWVVSYNYRTICYKKKNCISAPRHNNELSTRPNGMETMIETYRYRCRRGRRLRIQQTARQLLSGKVERCKNIYNNNLLPVSDVGIYNNIIMT